MIEFWADRPLSDRLLGEESVYVGLKMARRHQGGNCRALRSRDEDGWELPGRGWICPDALLEVGLHHSAPIGLDEENWIANEGANPVAPVGILQRELRTTMRSFLLIAAE